MLCVRWLVLAVAVAVALCSGARAQRPACPRLQAQSCVAGEHDEYTYHFNLNGINVTYKFTETSFILKCPPSIALDEPALPRFEPALRVREVWLYDCWPRNTSYATALHALNVTGLDTLSPGDPHALSTYHIKFMFNKIRNYEVKLLAAMPSLRNLSLYNIDVTPTDLAQLPTGERLMSLDLVLATVLARLPHLDGLEVSVNESVALQAAGNLKYFVICTPATTLVNWSLPDTLKVFKLCNWTTSRPKPWRSCASLDTLSIIGSKTKTLPNGWLARCVHLRILRMHGAMNLRLLEGALRGAAALEEVSFQRCALEALPAGLLDDVRALRMLDLQKNHLHTLPGALFRHSHFLSELHLSWNRLNGAALATVEAVTSLRKLLLNDNRALNVCPSAREWSSLRNLTNLTVLSLAGTATSRVCADWRQLPRLQEIDLTDTAITELKYTDLLFNNTVNITVALSTVDLSMRREDYDSVAAAPAYPSLTLCLSEPLRCDCELYWAAAALNLPDTRLRMEDAQCYKNKRPLHDMSLDELVCIPPGRCPDGCACVAREDRWRLGRVLQLHCSQARLRRVPPVDARATLIYAEPDPVVVDLHLANNFIDRLAPEDLPPELVVLDLRYNALTTIDAATMAVLISRVDRRVWLAGNPLDCSCRAASSLAVMRKHHKVFHDLNDATCSDGKNLKELYLAKTGLSLCPDAGSTSEWRNRTVSDDTSEGVLQYTTPPAPRNVPGSVPDNTSESIPQYIMETTPQSTPENVQNNTGRPESGEWAYDAFVLSVHTDDAIVSELVEQLESGPAPLRLCVHYRDWEPGAWIPTLIAESVRVSRHTVAVVSEAFLHSDLARFLFPEVHKVELEEAEPRLVLVLLDDPARLHLDIERSTFVNSTNNIVRWGDPMFWWKLRRVLQAQSLLPVTDVSTASPVTITTTQAAPQDNTKGMPLGAVAVLALGAAVAGAVVSTALVWFALRRRLRGAPSTRPPSILRFERRRPKSSEWAYDAFVSFAHADEAIAFELVERLEGDAAPLRVCVHYRDWMPGGWIPAQIAASVRISRRTVALVSEAYIRSKWARAEFREAYAAALEDTEPRLVLVLLEDPAQLLLDSELAAYVSGITYVRWNDPWFWQKLRSALPAPSVRPVTKAAAANSSSILLPPEPR